MADSKFTDCLVWCFGISFTALIPLLTLMVWVQSSILYKIFWTDVILLLITVLLGGICRKIDNEEKEKLEREEHYRNKTKEFVKEQKS